MNSLEIRIVNEGDTSIYSRSAQSRMISAPSSPPLTSKAIQLASGRRKGFQSKNDSIIEKISEKKVSARMPRFEDGELKPIITRLESVAINPEPKMSSSRRNKDARPPVSQPPPIENQATLDPRLQKEYAGQLTQINVSPTIVRKMESNRRPDPPPKSNNRPIPNFGSPPASPKFQHAAPPPPPVQKPPMESPRDQVEIINSSANTSPQAARRSSPPVSTSKTPRNKKSHEKPPIQTSKPREKPQSPKRETSRKEPEPVYAQPESNEQGQDRYSNRRTDRPISPHRAKSSQVKVKGKRLAVSDDQSDTPPPKGVSDTASSTSGEVTSRRKIRSRQAAIEDKLSEKYQEDDFDPEENDEDLQFVMKAALVQSQKESVKEAIEAGHELSAEILGHVTRPNAPQEIIEKLVSQRREGLRESKRRQAKAKKESESRPFKPNRNKPAAPIPVKETVSAKNRSKVATNHPKAAKPAPPPPKPVEDDDAEYSSDEDPDIQTVDEPKDEPSPPMAKSKSLPKPKAKPAAKITVSDGSPTRPILPGTPIGIVTSPQLSEETEPLQAEPEDVDTKKPSSTKKKSRRKDRDDDDANVKMPKGPMDPEDEHYNGKDPLGQNKPVGTEDGVGDGEDDDDKMEESDEDDDAKMTIGEKKDEMLYRFRLVKESYPNVALPRITKKMKLAKMVRHYDHVMSRIKLKIKTGNFKIFLIGGFVLMQFAIKKMGFDSSGFALNQMYSMKRYERFLREIGESDFSSIGAGLPLMVRLPFFMAVNMGIFMVAKMIFKATGKDVTEQFYKLYSQLTGGDDYLYIKDEDGKVTDAEDEGGGGGGLMSMMKGLMSMFGGSGMGGGGGAAGDEAPKRGEATGSTYRRRTRPAKAN